MSWKTWWETAQAPAPGVAARGGVAQRAAQVRAEEHGWLAAGTPTAGDLTAGELALAAAGGGSIANAVAKELSALERAGRALVKAHAAAITARVDQDHLAGGPAAAERDQRERHELARREREHDQDAVGAHHLYINPRLFAALELVVLACEAGFFYLMMARSIDPRVSWASIERISAVLFAAFCPLGAIITERLAGSALGRRFRAPATDPAQHRAQSAALTTAAVVTVGVSLALFTLVTWRYDTSQTLVLGTPLPGWSMGLMFVAVMLGLAGLRAFTGDVTSTHQRAHAATTRSLRATARNAALAVSRADAAWAEAAWQLSTRITATLTTIERVAFTAEDLIATARARHGAPAPATQTGPLPALRMWPTPAANGHHTGATQPGGAPVQPFPSPVIPATPWHVNLGLPTPALTALQHAIDTLRAYAPTISAPQQHPTTHPASLNDQPIPTPDAPTHSTT